MSNKARSPHLTRFLSDFTLGFSDGLTVPFALTAGLSSLGRADTVIYAGLAELCAGSISMGIGGYLAAKDELPPPASQAGRGEHVDEEELTSMLRDDGSSSSTDEGRSSTGRGSVDEKDRPQQFSESEDLIRRHLEPLALSSATVSHLIATLKEGPGGLEPSALRLQAHKELAPCSDGQLPISPVASGLSISLGYVVGGIIPLFPYFFAATVGLGLRWSIGLCLFALMAFGSGKSWILRGDEKGWKQCLWEGMQMLILGTLAAAAAVLCVNLVGASAGASESGAPAPAP